MDDSPFANLPIQKHDGNLSIDLELMILRIKRETIFDLFPMVIAVFEKRNRKYTYPQHVIQIVYHIVTLIRHKLTDKIDYYCRNEIIIYRHSYQVGEIIKIMNSHLDFIKININSKCNIDIQITSWKQILIRQSISPKSRFNKMVFCNDLFSILNEYLDIPYGTIK